MDVQGLGHLHRRENLEQAGGVGRLDLDLLATNGAEAGDHRVERRTPALVGPAGSSVEGTAKRSAPSTPVCGSSPTKPPAAGRS